MACFDTTFLIDWLRGNERAKKKYEELRSDVVESQQQLSASIIAVYELEKAAELSRDPAKDLNLVRDLLSELVILELDEPAVDLASELY